MKYWLKLLMFTSYKCPSRNNSMRLLNFNHSTKIFYQSIERPLSLALRTSTRKKKKKKPPHQPALSTEFTAPTKWSGIQTCYSVNFCSVVVYSAFYSQNYDYQLKFLRLFLFVFLKLYRKKRHGLKSDFDWRKTFHLNVTW